MVLQQRASQPPLVSSHSFTSEGEKQGYVYNLPISVVQTAAGKRNQENNEKFKTCKMLEVLVKNTSGFCVFKQERMYLPFHASLKLKSPTLETVENVQVPGNSWELLRGAACVVSTRKPVSSEVTSAKVTEEKHRIYPKQKKKIV